MLSETMVRGQMRKVMIGGCKNGIIYVLDAATGYAYHALETPFIKRCTDRNSGDNGKSLCTLYDPLDRKDMLKPWLNWPDTTGFWENCFTGGCLESDFAYDPGRNMVYAGIMNFPAWTITGSAELRGASVAGCNAACQEDRGLGPAPDRPDTHPINSSIIAWDVDTGEEKWAYFMPFGFRGGVIVSGGVVYFSSVDGYATGLDADTGEVLYRQRLGTASVVQPTIGADADGNMQVIRVTGGRGFAGIGSASPGAIMAYGLRDGWDAEAEVIEVIRNVPGPERVVEVEREVEVEVVREVEVPGPEVIIEKEVEVEVEKIVEVEKEVEVVRTEEVISPVSYVVIGIGVILAVVGGVLYTRKS